MRVFKYTLYGIEKVAVVAEYLPDGAKVLTVQIQKGQMQLWALVDPEKVDNPEFPTIQRHFLIAATGFTEVPEHAEYISTVQADGGAPVFHIFEVTPKPR